MTMFITAANDPSINYLIDEEDADLACYRWDANAKGYARCWNLMTSMHQMVAKRIGLEGLIDHKNRDNKDNRRENLRVATKSQNGANTGKTKRNTSGYRGVQRQYGRWIVLMAIDGRAKWIGSFDTKEQAAVAYDIKAKEMYREFAYCNIPNASAELIEQVKQRMSSPKQRVGRSKYYGVSMATHRWRAIFVVDKRRVHIGYFDSEEEAAKAVDERIIAFGLERRLNFPLSDEGTNSAS